MLSNKVDSNLHFLHWHSNYWWSWYTNVQGVAAESSAVQKHTGWKCMQWSFRVIKLSLWISSKCFAQTLAQNTATFGQKDMDSILKIMGQLDSDWFFFFPCMTDSWLCIIIQILVARVSPVQEISVTIQTNSKQMDRQTRWLRQPPPPPITQGIEKIQTKQAKTWNWEWKGDSTCATLFCKTVFGMPVFEFTLSGTMTLSGTTVSGTASSSCKCMKQQTTSEKKTALNKLSMCTEEHK